jgi:hypothetical protein
VSDVKKWTPQVGDRVRVRRGHACAGLVYTVTRFAHGMVNGFEENGASCFFTRRNVELHERPTPVGPIAYVKQTRPEVPFDLRTPYQQRGWAP